jgi:hypothetical protein
MRKLPCEYLPRAQRSATVSDRDQGALITPPYSSPSSDEDEGASMTLQIINPTPLVMTSTGNLSQNDMRLMFQWSTYTYDTVGIGEHMSNVLRFVLPEMAFENEFLMNGMLGIASLHQQRLLPDSTQQRRQTEMYRFKALSSFRKAVAGIGPDSPNYEAALAMTILVVVLCSQDYHDESGELTIVRWVILYRGVNAIISMVPAPAVKSALSVGPVFMRQYTELKSAPSIPTVLMNMLAVMNPMEPDYEELPHYCNILDAMGILYASLRDDGIGPNLSIRVISWPSYGSDPFARLAREYRPRALVILAHYLVFMKLIKKLWWIEGIADREIEAIGKLVGPKYATFMEVPLRAIEMTDLEEIRVLMLR